MVKDEVWKNVFLTHFSPIFGPKTAHFQGILGFSEDQNGPPQAQNSPKTLVLASHMVLGSFLKKVIFCPYWTMLTHLVTHVFGLELAACRSLLGLCMGV